MSLKEAIHNTGRSRVKWDDSRGKRQKLSKDTRNVLSGSRILDLSAARILSPRKAYLYETTDGRRIRVFFGTKRVSTSATIRIAVKNKEGLHERKTVAIHHCLTWAWQKAEAEVGGEKCPYDFAKIKLQ